MALQSSVGIEVHASAGVPATWDDTGFAAKSYTKVGKPSSAPPMTGNKDIATFDNIETGEEEKLMDMLRAGNGELGLGYEAEDDAGQAILETAADATTDTASKISYKFVLPSGTVYYRTAIVTGYTPQGQVGQVLRATVQNEFFRAHVKVAV